MVFYCCFNCVAQLFYLDWHVFQILGLSRFTCYKSPVHFLCLFFQVIVDFLRCGTVAFSFFLTCCKCFLTICHLFFNLDNDLFCPICCLVTKSCPTLCHPLECFKFWRRLAWKCASGETHDMIWARLADEAHSSGQSRLFCSWCSKLNPELSAPGCPWRRLLSMFWNWHGFI